MYRPGLRGRALRLGLLMTLVALALSACGGGGRGSAQEEAKARPLPQDPEALRPGEYHSVDFKPSLSFHVGKGWLNTEPQLPDLIEVGQPGEGGWILFANVGDVYKPGTQTVVKAPEDLVGWFQDHPYLKTSKPESFSVGGVKGEQFDLVVDAPEDYYGECGTDCMDLWRLSSGEAAWFHEGDKIRLIILDDVKGDPMEIDIGTSASEFDEFLPEAQKVVDSVKWGGQ
jgi:hypothetical protein